jgi:hypothetical protein
MHAVSPQFDRPSWNCRSEPDLQGPQSRAALASFVSHDSTYQFADLARSNQLKG